MLQFLLILLIGFCVNLAVRPCNAAEPTRRGAPERKAPYKVLFSNDTTNIMSCVSPYHKMRERFRPEMLEATVDETAGTGIQVHMLQPGLGWVPWWKSTVYPGDQHYRWEQEKTARKPNAWGDYMLAGGDMVKVFVERCRQKGLVPFISLRLNDGHHETQWVSRFYAEHPEYRLGPDINDWNQRVHNWAIPEVREHKFAFIKEICEGYDIDGFELDFMRHWRLFDVDKTTSEQRRSIVNEFVARVRQLLDRTSKPGQRRWLCVRVPCFLAGHDAVGINVTDMAARGVDMFNLSDSYFTNQQTDLPVIRKMVPDAAVYLEMTHCTMTGPRLTRERRGTNPYRRTTDEQFYTTAHLAYARGADGLSAFNFVYYREHVTPEIGPFHEPPFHIFKHLGDPEWLARQPQHYILAKLPDKPAISNRQFPKRVNPQDTVTFTLDMAPPEGGWKTDGKLRIQGRESLGTSQWKARFNGVDLKQNSDVSEPYPNPYPSMLGTPDELRAWTVPVHLLKDGPNTIEINLLEGKPVELIFLDVAVR